MDTRERLTKLEDEEQDKIVEEYGPDALRRGAAAQGCFAASLIRYLTWHDARLAHVEALAGILPEDLDEP